MTELEKIARVYHVTAAELLKRTSVPSTSDTDDKGLSFLKALEAAEEKHALLLAENAALTFKVLELTTLAEERPRKSNGCADCWQPGSTCYRFRCNKT
jgi:hypothetical protein